MARKLREFPAAGIRGTYPWDEWLDGSVWELVKGKDYDKADDAMKNIIKAKATPKSGLKVRTYVPEEGKIVFQFYPRENGVEADDSVRES